MVAFLTVHKMAKRQPAKKATGAFVAVANRHIYRPTTYRNTVLRDGIILIKQFFIPRQKLQEPEGARYQNRYTVLR